MTETTTLPIPPDTLLIIAALLGIGVVSYITFLIMPKERDPKRGNPLVRVGDSLGFRVERFDTAALLVVIFFIYFIIFFLAAIIALRALGGILFLSLPEVLTPTQTRTGLAFGTLLAAILGAPLIVWRSWVAQKTAAIAEESLFNDKINAAATDLAARRQATRVVTDKDGNETVLTEWEDDLVTRAAAIDRLEGLAIEAMERDDYPPAQRIARMLSIYVRELSEENPAKVPLLDLYVEQRLEASGHPEMSVEEISERSGYSVRQLQGHKPDWTELLQPFRRDVQRAVKSLSRINPGDAGKRSVFAPENIDLASTNLQGFDLERVNLQGANLAGAKLQGAILGWANLSKMNATAADMRCSNLVGADLTEAVLVSTMLQGANISGAKIRQTHCWNTWFEAAYLWKTVIQDVNFARSSVNGTLLRDVTISGNVTLRDASFRGVGCYEMSHKTLEKFRAHWFQMFHASSSLPEGHPPHWVAHDISYEDFITQWRAWAATLDPPITIAPDYRP